MKGLKFIYNVTHSLKGSVFLMKTVKKEDLKDLSKGDIIVLVHKKFPEKYLIKKVSHISGEPFDARGYVDQKHPINMKKMVPDNHVAVTGDHDLSFDSRYEDFGFVSKDNIVGKACLWPIILLRYLLSTNFKYLGIFNYLTQEIIIYNLLGSLIYCTILHASRVLWSWNASFMLA